MNETIVRAILKAGVVGAGGGGFPTHIKASAEADVVLANGAECEPLLKADGELMAVAPEKVLRGLQLMTESVGATRTVLAVRKENARALAALSAEGTETSGIEFLVLENVYPAGDEFLLVFEATGRVVPEGGIPPDVGVVVSNVTTLADVADAFEGKPVTTRMVSVQGDVPRAATWRVPIGTAIEEVLALSGGIPEGDVVLIGGPMMGQLAGDLGEPITKTTSGLIVLPPEHALVSARTASQEHVLKIARAACCQCMACTDLCPRALLGHALAPHRTVRAVQYSIEAREAEHITSAYLCCECGMCELFACPLGIQPRRILADLKAELVRRGIPNPHHRTELTADDVREYRQIPSSRLVQRLGLTAYDREAPLARERVEPLLVRIALKQHVGAPAVPIVREGDHVVEGDLLAEIPDGQLGARVHASITGFVESVTEAEITVTAAEAARRTM